MTKIGGVLAAPEALTQRLKSFGIMIFKWQKIDEIHYVLSTDRELTLDEFSDLKYDLPHAWKIGLQIVSPQMLATLNEKEETYDDICTNARKQNQGALKFDADKAQMELLSAVWVDGVSRVLTFGAKKYSAHNWRKGMALSRLIGAALRHTFAFLRGEDLDGETGLSHLYHASCCLMFASELWETRPECDDRYKGVK